MSSKVSTGRSYSTVEEKSSLSAKSQTLQNKEVLDRKREISSQLDAEAKRLAEQDQAAVAKGGSSNKPRPAGAVAKPSRQFPGLANAEPAADSTFWDINGDFAGNKATAGSSPGAPKPAEIPAGGGDLGLNDNVILQQRQAPSFSQEFTNIQGIDANGVAPGQNYTALGNARGNRRQVEQLAEKMEQTKPAPVPSPGSSLFSMAAAAASDASGRLSGKQEDDASRSNGRISLAVDFPTEGTVYHFKKIKANAVLEVSVIRSQLFERWKPAA
ncbi:MAG: hypothetical protein V4710_02700, partial [Verrucomicrobiota bacterium]